MTSIIMPSFVNTNFVTPTVTKLSIPSLRRTFPFTFFIADVKDYSWLRLLE